MQVIKPHELRWIARAIQTCPHLPNAAKREKLVVELLRKRDKEQQKEQKREQAKFNQ